MTSANSFIAKKATNAINNGAGGPSVTLNNYQSDNKMNRNNSNITNNSGLGTTGGGATVFN